MSLLNEAQKIIDGSYNGNICKWIEENKGLEFIVKIDDEYNCVYPDQLENMKLEYDNIVVIDIISLNTDCDDCKWNRRCHSI